MSHFKDEGKDYYLLYLFYRKLLQFFVATVIVFFFLEKSLIFSNFNLWKSSNRKLNIFIQQYKDNDTGNYMKNKFWLYF